MIYSFDTADEKYLGFIRALSEYSLDYEVVRHDKIVVRVFGRPDKAARERLDSFCEPSRRLILKKGPENDIAGLLSPGEGKIVIAGPCSVESYEQLDEIARFLSGRGVRLLRGGAFKPRTQSNSFQGLGRKGLEILGEVAQRYDMKIVTELMDRSQIDEVSRYADVIQIGSRNMFNYTLLTAMGAVRKPVLLKRGMAATIDEWIHASEYIRRGGNEKVILCERGIRTFDSHTRFTLDVAAIPLARKLSGLPVIADPSHAAGNRALVPTLMKAALAAGADGIMVEVHPRPNEALSDSAQSMNFDEFGAALDEIEAMGLLATAGATIRTSAGK